MSNIGNPWVAVRAAVEEAENIQSAVQQSSVSMAGLLRGNLRHVPHYLLCDLKRELTQFDAHKKEWKP